MRRTFAAITPWLAALLAVLALVAAIAVGGKTLKIAVVLICGACLVAITRMSIPMFGVVMVVLFAFTASWDTATLAGVHPRVAFLLIGVIALGIGNALRDPPFPPWWLHLFAITAVVVSLLQLLFPTSPEFIAGRYATSAIGQALGARGGGNLLSLVSLLFNTYVVPMAVVMACMYARKAFGWIVGAYVTGVALSSLAAYLGYIGHPFLLDVFGTPYPDHVRAIGFTSFPLRLGTTVVFAVPFACWLAVRGRPWVRYANRAMLVLLLLGMYSTGSRGATVATMAALGFSFLLLPNLRRRIHWYVGSVAVLTAGLLMAFPTLADGILRTTRIAGDRTTEISDIGRGEVFQQGMADLKESPVFGIGLHYLAEAHITYIGVLAAGGVLLFVSFLALNLGAFGSALRTYALDRSLGAAMIVSLLTALVYWTVAVDFAVASVEIIYGFVIAAGILARRNPADSSLTPPLESASGPSGAPVEATRWLTTRIRA